MNMNITEKSKEYAKGKALEAITAAIEQAYTDGYNDGLKHLENEKLEAIKDGVEYVDLGLPETLWSKELLSNNGFIRSMTYLEASKLNIPTVEQFKELFSELCVVEHNNANNRFGFEFKGITGDLIFVYNKNKDELFWLKDDEEDSTKKNCAYITKEDRRWKPVIKKVFMGEKLPVMLVRKK